MCALEVSTRVQVLYGGLEEMEDEEREDQKHGIWFPLCI